VEILGSGRSRAALLLALSAVVLSGNSVDDQPSEYQVKAAFLYNFLKFVDWPAPAGSGPWVIGVVGGSEFAAVLDQTVHGKTVNGQPVAVKRLASLADARGCHIVFKPGPTQAPVAALPGVLTVGDDPRFLDAGGIVSFYLEDNRVRFEIRPEPAKAVGQRISAQLLKLGKAR
jgi:hypothetical protein